MSDVHVDGWWPVRLARACVHVGQVPVPPTIDDPAILEEITHVFKTNAVGPLYAKNTL